MTYRKFYKTSLLLVWANFVESPVAGFHEGGWISCLFGFVS